MGKLGRPGAQHFGLTLDRTGRNVWHVEDHPVMGQPGRNSSDYTTDARSAVLDGSMTAGDIIDALEQLRFENGLRSIKLDGAVRDFIVAALSVRRGKGH